ncbi:MAG TPA: ABC transporter permease subunit [Chloroflexota bacterium]|nr:ABC transporter permease subunit [Chloroflexota bacterium]
MSYELKILFAKEWKQAVRNRGALLTATLLPLFLLLIVPVAQAILATQGLGTTGMNTGPLPPGLTDASPEAVFVQVTFPLFVVLGGLIVPSLAASHTVVSEREKRTVDLLMALPVSLGQIVAGKVAAVVALALAITLPLVLIDFVLLSLLGLADLSLILFYALELLASLTFSVSSTVAIALLARDYRSANNLSGAFMGPMILLTMAFNLLLPWGLYRLALHAGLMLLVGFVTIWVTLKVVSLERYAL